MKEGVKSVIATAEFIQIFALKSRNQENSGNDKGTNGSGTHCTGSRDGCLKVNLKSLFFACDFWMGSKSGKNHVKLKK